MAADEFPEWFRRRIRRNPFFRSWFFGDIEEMISRVSEVVAEIEAGPLKNKLLPHTWCVVDEVDFGNWGIGGNAVTPEMLKAILEG